MCVMPRARRVEGFSAAEMSERYTRSTTSEGGNGAGWW